MELSGCSWLFERHRNFVPHELAAVGSFLFAVFEGEICKETPLANCHLGPTMPIKRFCFDVFIFGARTVTIEIP